MNYGALIFLGTFLSLAISWFGLILLPYRQIGGLSPDKTDQLATLETRTNWLARQHGLPDKPGGSGGIYPTARPGLAQLGAEIYRANGCAYCHTRQVQQTGTTFDVILQELSTNQMETVRVIVESQLSPEFRITSPGSLQPVPKTLFRNLDKSSADNVQKALTKVGAQAQVVVVPLGPDIGRGWGLRQTVAQDYLYDSPVLLGSQRIGPDLANVGLRLPDPEWHLRHFLDPRMEVKNSVMPPYRFLFEKRNIPGGGSELVPTTEARALAAYLVSLRADVPLFEAPMSEPKPASRQTNAPTGGTSASATDVQAFLIQELRSAPVNK